MSHFGRSLALGAGVVALGFAGAASASTLEFALVEHADGGAITHIGPTSDSVGDLLTFHNHLFNAQNRNRQLRGLNR